MRITTEYTTLKEILKSQTKDSLKDLTYSYPIKGKSKLKKDELVEALNEKILSEENKIENIIILVEAFYEIDQKEKNKEYNNISKARKICDLGYGRIITNDSGIKFVIANETNEIFNQPIKDLNVEINRYALIKKYVLACVRLYGICEMEFLIKLFNDQNPSHIPLEHNELNVHINRIEKMGLEPMRYTDCIISESLLMFEGEIEELFEKRANKDFYIPSQEELFKYEDEFYVEENKQYLELENFINKKVKDKEMAKGLVEDLAYKLRFEDVGVQSAVNEFQRRGISLDSFKDLEKFIKLYVNLANNTRCWCNKGNTPEATFKDEQIQLRDKVEIGRNEPCPCKSGKKYKKCCMK